MQATRLARHMVADCGMSNEIGPVHVESMADSSRVGSSEIWRHVDLEVSCTARPAAALSHGCIISDHMRSPSRLMPGYISDWRTQRLSSTLLSFPFNLSVDRYRWQRTGTAAWIGCCRDVRVSVLLFRRQMASRIQWKATLDPS